LVQTVPETARTQEVYDALAFFRTMIREVDSSLVEEWESLIHPEALSDVAQKDERRPVFDLAAHPKILTAQVRAEMHGLVRALAARDFEQAVLCVKQDPEDPWDAARFERELAPFFDEYQEIVFTPQARQNRHTLLASTGQRCWDVQQVLVDPEEDCLWCVYGTIDLGKERSPEGPLIQLRRIGT
jgi:hypothetical protein